LLPKVTELFADMKRRRVHHGTPTAGALLRMPQNDPGRYLAQALALLEPTPSVAEPPDEDDEVIRRALDRGKAMAAEEAARRAANPDPRPPPGLIAEAMKKLRSR